MTLASKLTPKGAMIVAALERFRDAIESGARSSSVRPSDE